MTSVLTPRFWFRKISHLLKPKKPKNPVVHTSHHDLQAIFHEVNTKYFSASLTIPIAWSGKGTTNARRVIRLGSYHLKTQKIKINRVLDAPHIPRYFLAFIVYHEALHHLFPPLQKPGSKRRIHHPLFMQKEREFEEYEEAQAFLKTFKKKLFFSKEQTL
jgi:predicted SprT family Zn-dependent metalloprotease